MKIREILTERFTKLGLEITDTEQGFKITNPNTNNGATIDILKLNSMYETQGDRVIEEYIHYINETLQSDQSNINLADNIDKIYPVIRSTSFPKSNLAYVEHTAETNIFLAFDTGNGYHLINNQLLKSENLTCQQLLEISKGNLAEKPFTYKKQTVAGNDYYFVNTNDGYDASRILLTDKIKEIGTTFEGEMVISTPHQDVLIISDLRNQNGYDIISNLSMDFFTRGDVPITSLSFEFDGENLTPIFIMAKGVEK